MSTNTISLMFSVIASSISVGAIVWKIIMLRVNSEIILLRHSLELKDLQIENLQDVQTLLSKGLEEKFEHFSTRIKSENLESRRHLAQVIHFLAKSTEFEPRD